MMRIESLESPIRDGVIKLHSSQSTLLEQLRQFPDAPHDDGPDALEMLYRIALTGNGTKFKDIPRHNPTQRSAIDLVFGGLGKIKL